MADAVYIDSSSLLKLLWQEAESHEVVGAVAGEDTVVISVLTEIETLVQLKAAYLGGEYGLSHLRRLEAQFGIMRNHPPYEFRPLAASIFRTALRQHRNSGNSHCRSLDRLHLAAMEELDVSRLMTHDEGQANAARDAGFHVISPGTE